MEKNNYVFTITAKLAYQNCACNASITDYFVVEHSLIVRTSDHEPCDGSSVTSARIVPARSWRATSLTVPPCGAEMTHSTLARSSVLAVPRIPPRGVGEIEV